MVSSLSLNPSYFLVFGGHWLSISPISPPACPFADRLRCILRDGEEKNKETQKVNSFLCVEGPGLISLNLNSIEQKHCCLRSAFSGAYFLLTPANSGLVAIFWANVHPVLLLSPNYPSPFNCDIPVPFPVSCPSPCNGTRADAV